MSWIQNVIFHSKEEAISEDELHEIESFLSSPLNESELEELKDLSATIGDVDYKAWELPELKLPNEYIKLLKYANGGELTNGEREFGFFGKKEIRDYYLRYMFPEWQPKAVPIGFNGGGVFYAYDLRQDLDNPPIIATASGVLDWGDSVILGTTLEEVFTKDTNIENELY